MTPGFELPNPFVIHTRAASFINGDHLEKYLDLAVAQTLRVAKEAGIKSMAMPAIAEQASFTFWYVIPTLPMFLVFPFLLARFGFWSSMGLSLVLTIACFFVLSLVVKPMGIELL